MNLIISGELSAPPSEIYAFRTLTLYATVIKNMDCLVEVLPGEVDYYHTWLKNKYAMDFIKEFVLVGEEHGCRIHKSIVNKLTFDNLNFVISIISK